MRAHLETHPGWYRNPLGAAARGAQVIDVHCVFGGPQVEADGRRVELP